MNPQHSPAVADLICAECGSQDVRTVLETQSFPYGAGARATTLTAMVPMHQCQSCRFEFTSEAGERARHDAVCRHLGVMTPSEVVAVRSRIDLNRAEFARITNLSEASLLRWEAGELIQNASHDSLLYLLRFKENIGRLRDRRRLDTEQGHDLAGVRHFIALTDEEVETARRIGQQFELQRAR